MHKYGLCFLFMFFLYIVTRQHLKSLCRIYLKVEVLYPLRRGITNCAKLYPLERDSYNKRMAYP